MTSSEKLPKNSGFQSHHACLYELSVKLPGSKTFTWLDDKGGEVASLTVAELYDRVTVIAKFMTKTLKLNAGERVILSFPPGPEFLPVILACFATGIIAVPTYPPNPGSWEKDTARLALIAKVSGSKCVLTNKVFMLVVHASRLKSFFGGGGKASVGIPWKSVPDSILFSSGKRYPLTPYPVKPDDVAFLQFTSGSTGDPKGVVVRHGALVHNLASMQRHLLIQPGRTLVSWMPQYHDFGLIVMMLLPTMYGGHAICMSPLSFLKDPIVWLSTITKYRGYITASPNFGYARCVIAWNRLPVEKRPTLDLSNLRWTSNAAEPIRISTLRDFQETFGPFGFKESAMIPSYGLAEHVVYAGSVWESGVYVDPSRGFVACVKIGSDEDIEFIIMSHGGEDGGDAETPTSIPDGEDGEIWMHSPSVAGEYWGRPEKTKETFQNPYGGKLWLRTGDLGYIKDGRLFITGRLKDVIIVSGRNVYPQDVEVTVEKLSKDIRPGCSAAFQVNTGLGDDSNLPPDAIGMVVELRKAKVPRETMVQLLSEIRQAVTKNHGLSIHQFAFVKPRTIPKTTSGKIRRSTCKEMMSKGGAGLEIVSDGLFDTGSIDDLSSSSMMEPMATEDEITMLLRSTSSVKDLESNCTPEMQIGARVVGVISDVTGIAPGTLALDVPMSELGIGSLQAIHIGSEIEDTFGVTLDLALFLEGGTLEQVIEVVTKEAGKRKERKGPSKGPPVSESQVASFNQSQMFILDSFGAGSALNIPFAIRFKGTVNVDALKKAAGLVVCRHPCLRSHFETSTGPSDGDGSRPTVRYSDLNSFRLPWDEKEVVVENDEALMVIIQTEATRPFDLRSGPLVRAVLLHALDGEEDNIVLIWTMHHAISDGWSVFVVMKDLASAYNQFVSNSTEPVLPALPTSYELFTKWQQNEVANWGDSIQYWRSKLTGAPEYLALPYKRSDGGNSAGILPLNIPSDVLDKLNALAGTEETTLFTVLAAITSSMLMQFCDQTDITIGAPTSGRDSFPGLTGQVGYFVNTFVMRFQSDPEDSFQEYLQFCKKEVTSCRAHDAVPYQCVLQEALKSTRTPFQVYLILQDSRLLQMTDSFHGVESDPIFDIALEKAQFELAFELIPADNGLRGRLVFNEDKLDRKVALSLAHAFQHVCTAIAEDSARAMRAIPLIDEQDDELREIFRLSAGELQPKYFTAKAAHKAFESHAAKNPKSVCLVLDDQSMTYGEVDGKANVLARALVKRGIKANVAVAILSLRSFEMVIAMLAVMKSGGCYVPLDAELPVDRLQGYIEDSAAPLVLTVSMHQEMASQMISASSNKTCAILLVDKLEKDGGNAGTSVSVSENDAAYIEFTSGSTGRPKGVVVPHRALSDFLCWAQDTWSLTKNDPGLLLISIQFDPHVAAIFTPLFVGSKLVIARPGGHNDPEYIMELMAKHRVAFCPSVPSFGWDHFRTKSAGKCDNLRGYLFGGEPLQPEIIPLVQRATPHKMPVCNVYGPTEATVLITLATFTQENMVDGIHLGRPNANAHCYVVNTSMEPVPVGAPGELLLSGPRLAIGYIGRQELTNEKFVVNPFISKIREWVPKGMERYYNRVYKTGDLVRWRADGNLDYLGRIDRQVKVNGVRIELGEIETCILSMDGVEQAIVTPSFDEATGIKRLVAYITPEGCSPNEIVAHCKRNLIPAMVPSAVLSLGRFPVTANGKVDVKALPPVDWNELSVEVEYVAPKTNTEEKIQKIWGEVLGKGHGDEIYISCIADFLSVGGTSLLVIRMAGIIQERFDLGVPLNRLHELSTIQEMGEYIDGLAINTSGMNSKLVRHDWTGEEFLPLSYGMEQMYTLSQFDQTGCQYNEPLLVDFVGELNVELMRDALLSVMVRQQMLRICIGENGLIDLGEGGRLMDRLPIQTVDLSKSIDNYTGDPRQNPQIEQVLLKSAREPFKLSERAPLWRLLLVKLSDKRTVGLFTLHHAIMDGWSMGVVVSDLCTAYNDMGQPLAPLPVQYVDYAKWNRQWLTSPDAQGNSEWWFENLESATKLVQLPHDYPRPQAPSGKGGSVHATLDQETVALVKRFAARNSVTRYSIFVSIYRALLCRLSGSNDLIIGTTASNRPVNTEEIIGYMLNVLPLHNRIDESDNLLSLCQSELKTLKAALGHGMLPFQKIVEVAKVERSAAYNPLVQVLITTEEEGFLPRLSMNKLKPTQVEYFHTETNKMDMNLAFFPLEDEYVVGIEYNADIFAPNTAQAFLDMYITLLGRAIRNPGEKLMALPMMSPQSMGSIFSRLCAGPLRPDYVQGPLTTQLFEMWARKSTASPCLVFENETLSYGEVNDRANRMARKLVDLGVGRNVAVGLMMDRSFELVISMLAAMKAGGCYVPLDPDYPDDRLSIYMEDSSAAVLVAGREHLARANQLGGENANWSVLIAEDFDWNSGDSSNLSENLIARDSLAYVIFTSGSTGRPKGVMIDHIALLDFVRYNLEYYNVTERDTCLLSITINFDPHVMQVFTGLAGGSRLVIAKPGGHVDAEYMSGLIADWDVSFYNTVPALGLEYYKTEGAKRCTSLKSAIFSGEAMPIELVDLIYRNVPQGVQVVNAYGPTEATVMATNLRCEPGMTSMTIGFPEYNMHCYIVDASMNMVPPGVPGELLLSGPRLAQGYIGRPDLTAEKFTENPCYLAVKDSLPKELLSYFAKAYRTGDLCRFKQDGQIDYLGRIDNQVKINGVRLELSEVEAALGTAPHVDQAIVIAIKDPISNEKRLVGYVTPGDVDVDIVGAHCRSRLIPAMVPSAFVAMDAFPLLPNGKVNAKALPTPVFKSAGPYQAPRTILEEKLQAIWTTVLGLQEPISVLEDFFTAGGTSLQVFKLNGLMASELSVAFLPPTFIHTHRTIRSAATALEKLQVSGRDVAVKGISARSWPDALRPLSANQEQMWIIYKTDPRSCAYNMPLLLTFSGGSLDQERLRESLNALAAQHENLRMHFKESEDAGSAVCEISDLPFTVPLEVSESYSLAEVERIIRTPFDLETDALVRVHLWPGKESRLLVVLHHAVADAWSQKLFLDSLASAYNQTSKGDEIRLEQLPVQYGDFASWQKEHLTCPEAETHRGYWKENLSGSPDRIQLPTKGPRLGNVKPTAESISLKVPPAALSKAAATASTLGVNLQAVLMACLQIILCRYSDQDEVIVGVPVAGREMTDTHNLIGYFINTIPVRGGIADGGSSFGSLCIAASQTLQEGLNHSSLPLTDILAAAGARRSHGINPLFQVLFQYIPDAESVSVTFEGVEKVDLCLTPPALNMAKLDLLISLNGTGDLNIEYMDALYDVDTIERIGRCFVSVLSTVVADPSVRVSDISLVTDEDLRLVKSFATGCIEQSYFSSPYPVHMFEDAALKHPDRVALECEGATMTYGRLNTLANILAAKLASKGIQHNSCVGIMLHRSFELIICMLAVLKTGAGYLTLDPDYPDERLAIYAEDSRVDILLASDEVKLRAKSLYNGEIVTVDKSFTEQTTERSVPNLPRDLVQFDGACYAIFTSGSTGRPKGAQLLHGGLRDLILWMLDYWGCTETDKVAMTNTISFDAHVLQVYPPLCVGGTLAIAKPGGHLDAEYLANFLVEKKITGILFSVPTLSREWAKALPSPCPSLRMHSLGGEVVTKEDMYLMRSAFPNIEGPHNAYGPTEVTALTVCWKMIDGHEGPLPLGRPNTNVQAYVVDSKLRPVPVGVPGELLLSGPRLGRGYIGREDLTNAAFIPNPCFEFIDVLPTLMRDYYRRAYRTGDLVRWLPDGNIEYLGRIDRQVKVNGVRIELGEVEETLMARPDVDSAIAQAVLEPSSGMKRLVGYVTPKTADIGRALEHCRDSLIAAMVPSVIVPLEHFPVLPNGKVDAKSLPAPDWSGEEVEYIAPRNDVEKCLQEIWMDALGTSDSISVLTDFFSAGGTSIQVFKVIAQMQKMLGLSSLAPTIVQENRTIAGVAEAIQRMDGVSSESGPEPLVWEDDLRPLSANQEQMWVLFKSLGSSSAYNVPVGLRVQGNVDLGKLQLSLDNVVGRHETLRSYFVESDGEASIKIKDSLSYEIERYKCRSEDTLASAVANFVREPIDILKAPLFRVKLFQGPAPDGNLLVTTMHHSISDGWSMEVFLQEIAGSYRTCTEEGVPDNLGALHMQYGDYASWQQKKIKSQFADHERQWWRQKLLGIPLIIQLPADRTRPENPTSKSGNLRLNLPVDLMENLSTVASSLQVNMQAVLLSALQVMLSKYSGQDDVVIGMPTAGRDLPSTHPLIGYFINTTAVRSLIDLTETLETHIRRTSRSVLECQQHSFLPFAHVVAALNLQRQSNANPVFQVMFQYLANAESSSFDFGDLQTSVYEMPALGAAKVDLQVVISSSGRVIVDYAAELFDELTIRRFLTSFRLVLESMVSAPGNRIGSVRLQTPAEVAAILSKFSPGPYSAQHLTERLVPDAIDCTATEKPERVMLVFEGREMTYGEVNRRANSLAAHLVDQGVERNVVVGLMLERSFDLVVSTLAIWKAGGIYLPLDPDYPDERLRIYLEDTNASALISVGKHLGRFGKVSKGSVGVTVDLESFWSRFDATKPVEGVKSSIRGEDGAYIEFTSGSTGRPKAMLISHRNFTAYCATKRDTLRLNADTCSILTISINFDPHIRQSWAHLFLGGKLVIASPGRHVDADYVMQLVADSNVSYIYTVPTLGLEYFASPYAKACKSLKYAVFSGERLPAELVELVGSNTPAKLPSTNVYGPTECTLSSTTCVVKKGEEVTIGRPDHNVHCYIVDSGMHPVPIGVPGELLLSGPRLSKGYIGRPDLTSDVFIDNPCYDLIKNGVPGALRQEYSKAYRTGDLVRWRKDGVIEYLGRIDRQVKIEGVRVELGEVESAMEAHPRVARAVAKAVPDPRSGKNRLVGYIVPSTVDESEVRSECQKRLVSAMVPAMIVKLDAFPLLPNGKVDYKSLPTPDMEGADEEFVDAKTPLERKLQEIWSEVLGLDTLPSIESDFFAIGGTSLQTFRLVALISKRLGTAGLPPMVIHANRTVEAQATYLEENFDIHEATGRGSEEKTVSTIPRMLWEDTLRPLSPNQEQMWSLYQAGKSAAYNVPILLRIKGNLNEHALEEAFNAICRKHENLRIRFEQDSDSGEVRGRVVPATGFKVPFTVNDRRKAGNIDYVHQEALKAFDLVSDALIRVSVFHLSEYSVILVNVHHAVGDAWSSGIILQELSASYSLAIQKESDKGSLPALPIQYADFVVWQLIDLERNREGLADWWKTTLAGIPQMIQLPTEQRRPENPKYSAGSVHGDMKDILQKVIQLAAANSLSTQALLMAALQAVLCRYSGQDDIAIGVPVAGRELPEVQPLIGYFINTAVVRGTTDTSISFLDLASQAYMAVLDAVDHSRLPFAEVVSASGVKVASNINPIFQVLFQYVPDGASVKPYLEGLEVELLPAPKLEQAKTDLSIFITGDGHISIDYMDEVYDEALIKNIMASFMYFLDNASNSPADPVVCQPISSPGSSEITTGMAVSAWRPDYIQGPLTTQLFEMWARKSTASPCLVFENETLSYGEVNDRANRMARKLVDLGVGRNVAVGLMMDRSFELVISMLAAMKAGGCYVPLDPDYPDDRLSIYMEDSSAAVLVAGREHLARANQLGGENANWSVLIAEDFDWNSGDSSNLSENLIARDSLAYVIFTSGSTGRPKGVMIDHIALLDFVRYNLEYYNVTERDTCLLSITINFDPHMMQVFTGLAGGSRLVIAKPGGHVDAEYMSGLIADWDVSFYNTVPALGLEYYKTEGAKRCTSLKSAIFSGEAMPIELVDLIYRNVPQGVQVVNAYGPTEATVHATNLRCEPGMTSMTIGFPEYNMHCYIVDASMNMVPPGVPGELLLSGPRLAQGYIGRPDLTAEKFIENPCYLAVKDSLPKELLSYFAKAYRTGDLCRFKQDGQIDYLGRIDNQVKINGVRLELSEVEAALGTAPHVDQAIVIAIKDPISNEKRLVGYVTPGDVDVDIVGAHCRSRLIPAMVPSAFVAMDAFPLLPNGKVNAKALPMPVNAFEEEEYVPPRNEVDAVIQGIWEDVLGLDFSVSIDSDFFDIGGSSLKAGIIGARITKSLGVEIAGKMILSERTIRRVSDALGSDQTLQLRVPTRRIVGTATLKQFFPDVNTEKTKMFGIEARMNASDLDLGEYLSRKPPPAGLVTRIFSAALMILCGLFATVITPLVSSLTFASMALAQGEPTFKSGWWLFLIGPGLYMGMMVCGFIIVPALKWILFPMKMTPGVYPLYGWTYSRWMAYNAVYRRVCGFLWPHIGGTWLWTAWLRLQGARIGKNATIFTQSFFEPDLVSVGRNTIIDDDALLTAAIVVPRGTFSDQGFLILSTTLVEEDCKVGRRAVLQAGSRLRAGHSLRPYGSTHSHHAIKKIGEDSEYPMFRPESGMTLLTSTVASCTMSFFNTLSYIPGCALAIACVAWAYSIPPLDFPAVIFGSLSYSPRGSDLYFKVIFLPVAGTLASGLVLTPVTMIVQYLMLALWKGVAVGKLSPGRRLQSQWDLFAYKVYINLQNAAMWGLMKMYLHTTVLSNPAYRLLGAKVGSDAHVDGIFEMEAVTIGNQATTGGDSVFRNIDETGTIHKIEVGNAASFGHTTFFPGCEVGAYSIIGNETLVQANRKVPESHNLQGDLLYPGGATRPADSDVEGQTGVGKKEPRIPKFDVFAPGTKSPFLHTLMAVYRTSYIVCLTFISEAMVNAVCWAPGSTALTVLLTYVRVDAGWGVGPAIGLSIAVILCIIPIGLIFLGLWMRVQLLLYRGYALWKKESVAGDSLRVRMLALAELRMQSMSESFKGSYIFNWLMRLAGWKVGKGSVIFGSMPQELTLLNPGNYSVLETGAVISTHYVQSGRVYYNNVDVGDDSWVQNRTRVLAANSVGSYARILPASMVLPNEDIPPDSIWAGVPAQTAGRKKEYRTLPDMGILRGESLIRRSEADSRKLRSTITSMMSSRVSALVSDGIRLRDRLRVGKKIFKRDH